MGVCASGVMRGSNDRPTYCFDANFENNTCLGKEPIIASSQTQRVALALMFGLVSVGSRDQQDRGMGVGTRETAYASHIFASQDVASGKEIVLSGGLIVAKKEKNNPRLILGTSFDSRTL